MRLSCVLFLLRDLIPRSLKYSNKLASTEIIHTIGFLSAKRHPPAVMEAYYQLWGSCLAALQDLINVVDELEDP